MPNSLGEPAGPPGLPPKRWIGFACTLCGECCRGGQVVRLNADDLELLCRHTGLADADALVAAGLVEWVDEADGHRRPRLRFRRRPLRQCPFLQNDLAEDGRLRGVCSLHPDGKPLVCHLAPLAREVVDDGSGFTQTWTMVAPVDGCPGMGSGEVPVVPGGEIGNRLERELLWMRGQRRANQ